MQIDPSDESFEPTKRYLIVIPGTGYFHIDSFDELAYDLNSKYADYMPNAIRAQWGLPPLPPAFDPTGLSSAQELAAAEEKAGDDAFEGQATILGLLAQSFVEQYQFITALNTTTHHPHHHEQQHQQQPYAIEVVSGIDYQPYTDTPLPKSSQTRQVVSEENLEEILQLIAHGQAPRKNYLIVLPLHEAEPLFRSAGLAGLIQINDLSKLPPEGEEAAKGGGGATGGNSTETQGKNANH